MAFWRRIWGREEESALAACTALDIGTEFVKALVFEIGEGNMGTVRGVGRKRQGLAHMQSGTVTDIDAVVDNCSVALQEAEEMAGFRPTQCVIGIAGELVKVAVNVMAGRGGGRPEMAQGTGTRRDSISPALSAIADTLRATAK